MTTSRRPQLLIAGIADGFGLNLAKVFANAGYDVTGVARSKRAYDSCHSCVEEAGAKYTHISCKLGVSAKIATALAKAPAYDTVIYNAHTLLIEPFENTEPKDFERVWRTVCFGAMQVAGAVLPKMLANSGGTVIFSGATAGIRGDSNFAAFASAKFALRGLAQSLAREYSSQGIHVSHVILDGLIEEAQTTQRFGTSGSKRMDPEEIARSYLHLASQEPSAWTHELDLRPFTEKF